MPAGIITGLMTIPNVVGISMLSHYPVASGLVTTLFACCIGFALSFYKTGNYIGVPGITSGLAPVLALGVDDFGLQNMAFVILLTAIMQAIAWRYNWQRYLLRILPPYLVEGMLAGIGINIAEKFYPRLTELPEGGGIGYWPMLILSGVAFSAFMWIFVKVGKKYPALPYIIVIGAAVIVAYFVDVKRVEIPPAPFVVLFPLPDVGGLKGFEAAYFLAKMIGFAIVLAAIDIIEQVMSNKAIERIDPLGRPCHTNNSLLTIWIANLGSSFFGGTTSLDGLSKSAANGLAGAYTKLSILVVAGVVAIALSFPEALARLPMFSLAVVMLFAAYKMIVGISRAIKNGKYALAISGFCAICVWQFNIIEGLALTLAVHTIISYMFHRHKGATRREVVEAWRSRLGDESI